MGVFRVALVGNYAPLEDERNTRTAVCEHKSEWVGGSGEMQTARVTVNMGKENCATVFWTLGSGLNTTGNTAVPELKERTFAPGVLCGTGGLTR